MLHKAWNSKGEVPYCFPRSSIKFQGHTGQNITDFDPNWAFPDYRPVAAFKSLRFALFNLIISDILYIHLTHRGLIKMAGISANNILNAFSSMKKFEFCLTFHWSLFVMVWLTTGRHWFWWQFVITWTNVDQVVWCHMASWGNDEFSRDLISWLFIPWCFRMDLQNRVNIFILLISSGVTEPA